MIQKKGSIGVKGRSKSSSFMVFVYYHQDNHVEKKKLFTDPLEASEYFKGLCGTRSADPASVVGVSSHSMRKYFRIDENCSNRIVLDLDWVE